MRGATQVLIILLLVTVSDCAVVIGACDLDVQCGAGTCCAISLWIRSVRVCVPLGQEGEECHPFSRKIPYSGKRQSKFCPCLPNLLCSRSLDGKYRCSKDSKNINF